MASLFTLAAIVVILSVIIKRIYEYRVLKKYLSKIPGPAGYPLIGNFLSFVGSSEKLWHFQRSLAKEYYPIYKLWNGTIGSVAVLSPDDIEIILTSKKHLGKTKIYEWLQPWLGTGLLTSTGSKWHSRRKILTPAFHFNILQQFMEVFSEQSEVLVKKLKAESSKPETNIIPIVTQCTLHAICETAMGTQLDETKKTQFEYAQAVYRMGELLIHRITRPWLFFSFSYFLTKESKEQKDLLRILHSFSTSVIAERKKNFKDIEETIDGTVKSKKRLAMLDLLISAKNRGVDITDEGIREEVDTFMFEGHDTTTAALCFTLMLLANHSEIQNKAVDEIREVFGTSTRPITFQDLPQLRYLEQIIKESLRLYPSVPFIARRADEEIRAASGYTIPANVFVHVHIFDLHHNPEIYPDPYRFDPERFSPQNCQNRHPFAYIPFSAGQRNCIGQKFAMMELKTIIAAVLRRYILKPVSKPSDIKMMVHLVLKSTTGIKIKFEERSLL